MCADGDKGNHNQTWHEVIIVMCAGEEAAGDSAAGANTVSTGAGGGRCRAGDRTAGEADGRGRPHHGPAHWPGRPLPRYSLVYLLQLCSWVQDPAWALRVP